MLSENRQWMMLEAKGGLFGVDAALVREVVPLGTVHRSPTERPWLRGLCDVRGAMVPTLCLRRVVDIPDCAQETADLKAMLKERRADHVRWVDELFSCVREGRPFKLTRDPHACKFGRWYDSYRADDSVLAIKLLGLGPPHARIHGIADTVLRLCDEGRRAEAEAILEHTRTRDLARVTGLLDEIIAEVELCRHQVLALLDVAGRTVGLSADGVSRVRGIDVSAISPTQVAGSAVLRGTAEMDGVPVVLLDVRSLLREAGLSV